jgi:TatD DNase family protein
MAFTDTHSHIYLPEFDDDREAMLERAEKEDVTKIIQPAIDSSTHELMLLVQKENPGQCFSMMGVHPCSIKENYQEELSKARFYLDRGGFVAIGEIGLDFYWDLSFTSQQYAAFNEQVRWAAELDLPVVIHSRNSIDECIKLIEDHQQGSLKGVFHCFSGNKQQAEKIIGLGFFLGIGGVVTFKNSGLDKVMADVNLDHVVLETDAPYLAPVPFRGKRNECSYIKYVAEKLALIKNTDVKEIGKITSLNAEKLFGKL